MLLYSLGIAAYTAAIKTVALWKPKARRWVEGRRGIFERLQATVGKSDRPVVWIHSSSLGEFEQGRPVIEAIHERYPDYRILLTFFSPSGYEIRKDFPAADWVFYLPADTPRNVRRFLDIVRPEVAVFVKYDYWLNYLKELRERKIRSYIFSSLFRRGSIFFKPWGGMFRRALMTFELIFVQNEESKNLLSTIGFDNVIVAGDTRFDRAAALPAQASRYPLIEHFKGEDRLFIVGSSWRPDEDLLIPFVNAHEDVKFVIAPHEMEEPRIQRLISECRGGVVRYSECRTERDVEGARVLIIDVIYASVYFAASRAYIATSSNLLSEEKMAVIVQQVCGTLEDGYFFPTLSGVARSINHYPIGDERPEEGIVNIALGLGKMVVDGGQTLRFSPRYPQKALQTSTLELTLRDTQREFYALDMRPSSFHISSDDSVNLARLTVTDHSSMRNVQHAASTWNMLENTISESPYDKGRKLITFNRILKYGSFPLAQIIENLLAMGEQEMRCPVEMEFAVNLDVKSGQKKIFNFLQIRPIISTNDDISTSWDEHSSDGALIYAERALGVGAMHGISDIVYVKPQAFDNLRTEQIATELFALNARMREEGRGYVLVGPGRWGSSDPFLGIPVKWSHISEARVIVECGLDNFRVEPSQGTHFFQNVTSLGIGYLTINPYEGDGVFDVDRLDGMEAAEEGEFLRRVSFSEPLTVYIDGRNNRGVIKMAK